MCMHYIILIVKAELDQVVSGLQTLDVLSLLRESPTVTRPLLVFSPMTLSAEDIFDMFKPLLSPPGSNARELEEDRLMKWMHFLECVAGKQLRVYASH